MQDGRIVEEGKAQRSSPTRSPRAHPRAGGGIPGDRRPGVAARRGQPFLERPPLLERPPFLRASAPFLELVERRRFDKLNGRGAGLNGRGGRLRGESPCSRSATSRSTSGRPRPARTRGRPRDLACGVRRDRRARRPVRLGQDDPRSDDPGSAAADQRRGRSGTRPADCRAAEPALKAYRRQVQFVLQDPSASLNPKHTVYEAVAEGIRIHRSRRRAGAGDPGVDAGRAHAAGEVLRARSRRSCPAASASES